MYGHLRPERPLPRSPSRRSPSPPRRRDLEVTGLSPPSGTEPSVEYLCQKYEALQNQLASVERLNAEQVLRQERLQQELRRRGVDARAAQDPLAAELAARHTSLVSMRDAARNAQEDAATQTGRLREEQLAGQRAEQNCAQLAEECKQRGLRYDQVLQQLAQKDRDIAMHRFEAASTSRRLEQTQADAQVIREDLRVESQRQLLVQGELQDSERALQGAKHQLRMNDQEMERLHRAMAERKQEVTEADAELLSIAETLRDLQQEKQRQASSTARMEEDCHQLDQQLRVVQQDLAVSQESNAQTKAETTNQLTSCESLRGELSKVEMQRSIATAEAEACGQSIMELESAIKDSRLHSVQVFRERDALMQQVADLKAEQQQLDGLCLALRRALHAESLVMEDMETELQMAFKRKESLLQDIAVNCQANYQLEKELDHLRPQLVEADQRSSSLEMSLVQKSKQLEDELLRERSLRQDLAMSPLTRMA